MASDSDSQLSDASSGLLDDLNGWSSDEEDIQPGAAASSGVATDAGVAPVACAQAQAAAPRGATTAGEGDNDDDGDDDDGRVWAAWEGEGAEEDESGGLGEVLHLAAAANGAVCLPSLASFQVPAQLDGATPGDAAAAGAGAHGTPLMMTHAGPA